MWNVFTYFMLLRVHSHQRRWQFSHLTVSTGPIVLWPALTLGQGSSIKIEQGPVTKNSF